ncbi:MAG: hypothetical protein H6742_10175 [Alphaproteobacteria bacterium]|nr:hypothetical protein [Alphaproteobacteria bacterium]
MTLWGCLLLLAPAPAMAGGRSTVEALVGGRTAPQISAQGPDELLDAEAATALAAVRADAETGALGGAWFGLKGEAWLYLPEPELSLVGVEPRVGWQPDLGDVWTADLGTRYSLEAYPASIDLSSGRAEVVGSIGPLIGPVRVALEAAYVRRDYLQQQAWSFQAGEAGLRLGTRRAAVGWRGALRLAGQANQGFTIDAGGTSHPATGVQLRSRADLGWTGGSVDLGLGLSLLRAWEGQVEDAARPQFTPLGQYAEDVDALSSGGFTQGRVELSAACLPAADWTVGLDGLLRLRTSDPGQSAASYATTAHVQGRVERAVGTELALTATTGLTRLDLVDGTGATDVYGWLGLRWRSPP